MKYQMQLLMQNNCAVVWSEFMWQVLSSAVDVIASSDK